jgi:hypothetical protein
MVNSSILKIQVRQLKGRKMGYERIEICPVQSAPNWAI